MEEEEFKGIWNDGEDLLADVRLCVREEIANSSVKEPTEVRIGKHYVRDRMGQVIFKGSTSYELMRALQMGINLSVKRISEREIVRSLEPRDFRTKTEFPFPKRGSRRLHLPHHTPNPQA